MTDETPDFEEPIEDVNMDGEEEERLDFSAIKVRKIPVTVGKKEFVLYEASGEAAVRYRNAVIRCSTFGPEGKLERADNIASTELLLVQMCLRTKAGHAVPDKTIKGWPNRVFKAIFRKAAEISELTADEEGLPELLKQREELDEKIAELEEKGDPAKNELSDLAAGAD